MKKLISSNYVLNLKANSKIAQKSFLLPSFNLKAFITDAFKEDIGEGDHTTLACIPSAAKGKAHLLIKENGILAGIELAKNIFLQLDKNIRFKKFLTDGTKVRKGDVAFSVEGNARSILQAERLVLNCMQRMSGIATQSYHLTKLCKGYQVKITDTRKTTPGFRALEKWAVKIGGGENHRFGLYDMILIKDNHVDYAGGIKNAIESANSYLRKNRKKLTIEIEARNFTELKEILSTGKIHRIMLDNFSVKDLKKAIAMINGKYETEASGGINENNIRSYAACGVDYISIGALTHHVKSLDMSLKAID